MKFTILSLIVLGMLSFNSEMAHAKKPADKPAKENNGKKPADKDNNKDGVCVQNNNDKVIMCVARKAKGNSHGFELVSGKAIACHTKKDARCEKAIDGFVRGPIDSQIVVARPEVQPLPPQEIVKEPTVLEPVSQPLVAEPVTQEPNNTLVICDSSSDRSCQLRLAELKRLEEARLAQEAAATDPNTLNQPVEDISLSRIDAAARDSL